MRCSTKCISSFDGINYRPLRYKESRGSPSTNFELYCQLLKQSVARLKDEPGADRIRAEVKLDFITSGEGGRRARKTSGTFSFAAIKDAE